MCPRNWNGSNLTNAKTRRAYQFDARDPTRFVGIVRLEDFQIVTRAHPIAWRQAMEVRKLAPSTICRKFSTLSSLFDYLCEHNAVPHNPVDGVKQPQTLIMILFALASMAIFLVSVRLTILGTSL